MAEQVVESRVLRFTGAQRIAHAALMVSFLGLALTGMPLLFSHTAWAPTMARLFGGFETAGLLHRFFAVIMIVDFVAHVAWLLNRIFVKKEYGILWGPKSLVPQPTDLVQMLGHFRWFVGAGPRPKFDRWTYWEKFDYWAVFWGMFIIGGSGLMLWFPEFFSLLLPGTVFNLATLVHGEEALLAVGFIFSIHFFNGHIRPEKFPMDTCMFSGRIPLEELKHERPAEYERLVKEGTLASVLTGPAEPWALTWGRVLGTLAVLSGLAMVGLIVFALFAGGH
jgi:cytochrome b subunit of formate dehydrogenase